MKFNLYKLKNLFHQKISKIIFFLFLYINNIIKYEEINYFIIKKEIRIINNYYKLNNKGILINKNNFTKNENPKVSIISAVYNREKYILRFLRSLQNQLFEDIEIIFIDDYSFDNSTKIITKYQREDKRIILLRNKKNKGTLISRNTGALIAKGEFLIFPDPDDMLSPNILKYCYETSKQHNFDLIRFSIYSENYFPFSSINKNLKRIIYQPELRTHLMYGYGYLKLVDGIISNKFVKKTLFLKSLNDINNYYLNQKMIYFEDGLINYALHLNAKSLFLLNHIGYYYIYNKESVSRSLNIDSYLKCFFIFLKFLIENTKNNKFEKDILFFIFQEYIKENDILKSISNYSIIYEEVINSLMNIYFIDSITREKLKVIKKIFSKTKNKLFNI